MANRQHMKLLVGAVFILGLFAMPFVTGHFGNSAIRIRREHGLQLPRSATHFRCGGDAWMIGDRGAASTFEMSRADMDSFVAQLKVRESSLRNAYPSSASIFPHNPQYQMSASWCTGVPILTHHCHSPTGDDLSVQIWPIDESRVGVCLYTDWN